MNLSLPDSPVEVAGALELVRTPAGVVPRRLPPWTKPQLPDAAMDALVQMPAGVRLRLCTDAPTIDLDVQLTHLRPVTEAVRAAVFEVLEGTQVVASAATTDGHQIVLEGARAQDISFVKGAATTVRFEGLPGDGRHALEIWLPHRAIVELRQLRVPDGATVASPPERNAPRWIHHGSSISHCMEVDAPTQTWPARAAIDAGVELQNLAFAGNCMLDPFVARTIRDQPADAISLKLGINVVNGDTMRERTFAPAVHGFLDTVREGHPTTPLLVVTPIWCPSVETHPGPNTLDPDGRFVAVARVEDLHETCLTLQKVRAALTSVVEGRRALGDENLHLLDGLSLFGAADAADLPDDLHPNPAGYLRMAQRFTDAAFGDGGAFAEVVNRAR